MVSSKEIFLRPVGGLCNRLRTLDSFVEICKREKINLTVLWTLDDTLYAPFHSLFQPLSFKQFELKILDCPQGFPELNLIKIGRLPNGKYKIDLNQEFSSIKNVLRSISAKKHLEKAHKKVLSSLKEIKGEQPNEWINTDLLYS